MPMPKQQWCNRRTELEVGFEEVWNTLPPTLRSSLRITAVISPLHLVTPQPPDPSPKLGCR
jgi:hypothetical protein